MQNSVLMFTFSLEAITKMLKMCYFLHVMRAHQSLEKDIILGITGGARKKGKPRMRWMDDIKIVTGLSVNDINQLVKDSKKGNSSDGLLAKVFLSRQVNTRRSLHSPQFHSIITLTISS